MSLSTTMKDYYWRRGVNYDKATKRLLEGYDSRPTVKAIPVVLSKLVETSVTVSSMAPAAERSQTWKRSF